MRLGLIVNPIAGMGGKVGLKGTDNVLDEAVKRGAVPVAPTRAIEFLRKLREHITEAHIEILTCPGIMGESEAKTADVPFSLLPMKIAEDTTAEDTKTALQLLVGANADIVVFVGGDGTAKDILDASRCCEVPVLGVPSGVKMYSGVFAVSPSDAVEMALAYAKNEAEVAEFEVVDADERAIRIDTFAVKLYGYLKTPFLPTHIQGSKQVSPETVDEKENQIAIARFIIEEMPPKATWILGPGTTVKRIAELLGIKKTLLGVDIYENGQAILDVDEKRILREISNWQSTWIVLSPIGHQGLLLGRGNQQISPDVIRHVGKQRIVVAATKNKLESIEGKKLRVDTGDDATNNLLRGYIRVVTDYREWRLMPVQ
jgi:predicted polyphosphate/ATP-dependent NAD kinase